MERHFLDWRRPCLAATVDYLSRRFLNAGHLDLGGVLVALPGGRAMRRLEELLVQEAEDRGAALIPPKLTTIGGLPEMLYARRKPFAEDLVQRLAWADVLRGTAKSDLEPLVRTFPEADDWQGWLALARMLSGLHRELAADALDFDDVLRKGAAFPAFETEIPRWKLLGRLQRRYLRRLDSLDLWDRQTARLFAIRNNECRAEGPIVLAGLVDLNAAQRAILDQVSDHVTALVFADDGWSDRFDEHGCLIPERWKDVLLDLPDEAIEVVDAPEDQAEAVLRAIASCGTRRTAEEIVIGVPDERIVPHVIQRMADRGLCGRFGAGRTVARTGPFRLLAAVARMAKDGDFRSFAAVVRHPDVETALRRHGVVEDYLTALDRIHREIVPFELPRLERGRSSDAERPLDTASAVFEALDGFVGTFLRHEVRPLADWVDPIVDLLLAVYGDRTLSLEKEADRVMADACEAIRAALDEWEAIPKSLMPEFTAGAAMELVLAQVQDARIPAARTGNDIELLGWLELTMDDAPTLILTGMNEGIVPSSRNSDPFLPNRLRRILRIEDNDRRYARDAYALGVLRYSKEDLRIIAGRRSVEDDPLHPSRLLFACDDETMTRRVGTFFAEGGGPRHAPLGGLRGGRPDTALEVPRPEHLAPRLVVEDVTSMRVTEFKDYLACPYRYFLKHRMKIDSLDDKAAELDAASFGSLAHEVLESLGRHGDLAATKDPRELFAFLSETLDALVKKRFEPAPVAAVLIQVEGLRRRFEEFATAQAKLAAEGWRIHETEVDIDPSRAAITVDGYSLALRGRIDRIDRNERTGNWRIIDYKTGDSGKTPEQTHRRRTEWIDLQLPLYARSLGAVGIEAEPETVELGYFLLPKKLTETRFVAARWNEDDFLSADETTHDVIRRLHGAPEERYWPPATRPPPFSEAYSGICQERRFGKMATPAEEDIAS